MRSSPPPPARSALELTLEPLRALLGQPDLTELCINRPGEVFTESRSGWLRESLPAADFNWCVRLAKLVANASSQRIDASAPLLSAALPSGERIQVVLPPATRPGTVAISIRKPAHLSWSVRELTQAGALQRTQPAGAGVPPGDLELAALLAARRYEEFLALAVRRRKNIIVSGPTGSGKTTWTKALIREIPSDERLISIEDAPELTFEGHPNHVRLFYSKDDQGLARVTPRQLLECCLRMKPDRILLAELRSEEAFEYLRSVNSGHPGSITSVHAASPRLAFEQLVLLAKQSPGGRSLARRDIRSLLRRVIDVVVQCGIERHVRHISEIWFRVPARALAAVSARPTSADAA